MSWCGCAYIYNEIEKTVIQSVHVHVYIYPIYIYIYTVYIMALKALKCNTLGELLRFLHVHVNEH